MTSKKLSREIAAIARQQPPLTQRQQAQMLDNLRERIAQQPPCMQPNNAKKARRRILYCSLVAAVLLTLAALPAVANNPGANKKPSEPIDIPYYHALPPQYDDGMQKAYARYATDVQQTLTRGQYTVTLEQVSVDRNTVNAYVKLQSEENLRDLALKSQKYYYGGVLSEGEILQWLRPRWRAEIDGMWMQESYLSRNSGESAYLADDHTLYMHVRFVPVRPVPDTFTLTLRAGVPPEQQAEYYESGILEGLLDYQDDWQFTVPIDASEANAGAKEAEDISFRIEHDVSWRDAHPAILEVRRLTVTPTSTVVIQAVHRRQYTYDDFSFEHDDIDYGRVEFTTVLRDNTGRYLYSDFDVQCGTGAIVHAENHVTMYTMPSLEATEISIIPVRVTDYDDDVRMRVPAQVGAKMEGIEGSGYTITYLSYEGSEIVMKMMPYGPFANFSVSANPQLFRFFCDINETGEKETEVSTYLNAMMIDYQTGEITARLKTARFDPVTTNRVNCSGSLCYIIAEGSGGKMELDEENAYTVPLAPLNAQSGGHTLSLPPEADGGSSTPQEAEVGDVPSEEKRYPLPANG